MKNSKRKIHVLLVEDSSVMQMLLRHAIESDPELQVIDAAGSAEQAKEMLCRMNPDVLVVDLFLPNQNGFELTREIMNTHPIPVIIVSAFFSNKDKEMAFQGITAGALLVLEKPRGPNDPGYQEKINQINQSIKLVSDIKLITRKTVTPVQQYSIPLTFQPKQQKTILPYRAVAMGSSLGGPQALRLILSSLPSNFPVPIFVVQHISPGFVNEMARWIQLSCKIKIRVPEHGETAQPGYAYLAPDRFHMTVSSDGTILLVYEPHDKILQPSVSRLLQSVADAYGNESIAVILTGMGSDGAKEMVLLRQKGAMTIVQNKETSTIFGMPGEAIRLGGGECVLPLEEIPKKLIKLLTPE